MRRALPLLAITVLGALGLVLLRRIPPVSGLPVESGALHLPGALHQPGAAPPSLDALPVTASARPERSPSVPHGAPPRNAAPVGPLVAVHVMDGAGAPPGVELELRLSDVFDGALLDEPTRLGPAGRGAVAWPARARHASLWAAQVAVLGPTTLADDSPPVPVVSLHGEELGEAHEGALELQMGHERWVVRATVRDPEGRPLRTARLEVRASRLVTRQPLVVTTGPAGELALGLWARSEHLGDFAALDLLRAADEDRGVSEQRALVALELHRAPTRGRLALDVTLEARDVIVSGRFEDPEGSPETARLDLEYLEVSAAGDSWQPLTCEVQLEGSRFKARGAIPTTALRLVPIFGGHAREPVRFEPGTEDLVVVLESYGDLSGRALLDPGVNHDQLAIVVRPSGTQAAGRRASWGTGGNFVANELEPGSWDLEVSACGRPFAHVYGIAVAGALPSHDPRLEPLDLRGRLQSLHLRVVDERDQPVRAPRVVALDETGGKHELGRQDWMNLWHAAPLDLLVSADGCREVLVRGVDSDRTVRLARGLALDLTVTELPELHTHPAWKVALWPAADEPGERLLARVDATLNERGRAELFVDAPGTWEVELSYMRHGQWTVFSQGASIGRVEVRDEDGPQRVRVTVPADYLERAGR